MMWYEHFQALIFIYIYLSRYIQYAASVRQWNLNSYPKKETWLNIYSLMHYAAEAFKKDDWRIPIWNAAATSKREWEEN